MFQNVDPAHHLRDTVAYLLEQRHADYALSAKGNPAAPLAWGHAALPPPRSPKRRSTSKPSVPTVGSSARRSGPLRYLINWRMAEFRDSAIHSGRRMAKWSGQRARSSSNALTESILRTVLR